MSPAILPVVCDTSVVSIIYRQSPPALFYEERLQGKRVVISFQTLEELYAWPLKNGWGEERQKDLMAHLRQYEVIWPDENLAFASARLRVEREGAGSRLNAADAWIAATALWLRCPLATHDADFQDIPGLELLRAGSA